MYFEHKIGCLSGEFLIKIAKSDLTFICNKCTLNSICPIYNLDGFTNEQVCVEGDRIRDLICYSLNDKQDITAVTLHNVVLVIANS